MYIESFRYSLEKHLSRVDTYLHNINSLSKGRFSVKLLSRLLSLRFKYIPSVLIFYLIFVDCSTYLSAFLPKGEDRHCEAQRRDRGDRGAGTGFEG